MRISAILFTIANVVVACDTFGQAPLNTLGTPMVIDFTNSVSGVNEGLFNAGTPLGSTTPSEGQLDFDAWNYTADAAFSTASQGAANFPGSLPNGLGIGTAGALTAGISAVDISGQRALAIQPTSSQWTAGSLTLRAQNNTGGSLEQLDVAYDLFVYNDTDRANTVRFFYSLSAAQDSWVEVAAAAVVSPELGDDEPQWMVNPVNFTISGFSINTGDIVYLRWVGDDVSGSGPRDEFAFTNISLTPQVATGPNLITSVTALPPFTQTVGTPSAAQSFLLIGSNLIDDATITAPAPFEVSLSETFGFASSIDVTQSGGSLPPTNVYVRMNSSVGGSFNGAISASSAGAGDALVGVSGTATSASVPQLFINELMASNDSADVDEYGEYDDWFEIYNPNSTDVDLGGWYVTDNAADLTKYQFPLTTTVAVVPANGFLLLWADNQPAQGDLHASFSLSSSGEVLVLVAPDGVSIVDSVSFGPSDPDVSYGREFDGQEPWVVFSDPTPGATNHPEGIPESTAVPGLRLWPDPAVDGWIHLDHAFTGSVVAADGRFVQRSVRATLIDVRAWPTGTYVLRGDDGAAVRFVK